MISTVVSLAPRWHTALLVSFLLTVAALGTWLTLHGDAIATQTPAGSRIVALYLPTLLVEWSLALYVIRIGRPKSALGDLLGARWTTPRRAMEDLGFAVALFLFIEASEAIYAYVFGSRPSAAVLALLPHSPLERAAWVVLATSVGFCEEVVYRGYLSVQIAAFSRSRAIGVVAQAVLFGLAHGQQGATTVVRFMVYGIAFGVVAAGRKSLLPGIVCHAAIDLSSGLLHQ